jgi:putative component of membrane protein insertase Oxa1/YidC/SpoIIIJ protein YidD
MTQRGLLTRLALLSIRAYQRHLSPIKGFSCALRVATGGDSCSTYGYRVIHRRGLKQGLGLLRRRMRDCGHAHRHNLGRAHGPLHAQRGVCDLPCDCDLSSAQVEGICDLCSCGCDLWDFGKSKKPEPAASDEIGALERRVAEARRRKQERR